MSDQTTVRRPGWVTALLLALSAVMIVVFVLLGNWQIRRLAWKQDLIAAVDARVFQDPVGLPDSFDADKHAYLRVSVEGEFQEDSVVLVKAVTEIGPGYWVMMPLHTDQGILWVNRGYVPPDFSTLEHWAEPATPVNGLLRPTVEGGTLLESNDPAIDRWVSRDTREMSRARDLGTTLPFFVDADHQGAPGTWPRGGLTVIRFNNLHLSYALTWYAMAALFAGALVYVIRSTRRKNPNVP